ncbi:hypothetical protein K0B03_00725 [Patescibacteria group bacterium]|nr:hypothetical protein [Patescibacteria group bacterium]
MGKNLSIDEFNLSNGELYTVVTNKKVKGKKGAIVAMIHSTKASEISPMTCSNGDTKKASR